MNSSEISLVSTEIIYTGRRLKLVEDTLRLSNGDLIKRERVEHPGAVVMLPILADGRVVLVRQFRRAVGRELLELPAGTLDAGESPEICAVRELQEEIGYRPAKLQSLGEIFPAPGFCNERQYLFLATDLVADRIACDVDESIQVETVQPCELRNLIDSGSIEDAKSIATIMKAVLSGMLAI